MEKWLVRNKNGEVFKVKNDKEMDAIMNNYGGVWNILDYEPTEDEIDRIVANYYD